MLILTRKVDESILIGEKIEIKVKKIRGLRVSIGVEAPKDMDIRRSESPPESQVRDKTG